MLLLIRHTQSSLGKSVLHIIGNSENFMIGKLSIITGMEKSGQSLQKHDFKQYLRIRIGDVSG